MSIFTPDEIRHAIETGIAVIVGCARAPELAEGALLGPGYERNYWCGLCHVEVQISPRGRDQLAAGGVVTCTACGIDLAEKAQRSGQLADFKLSPDAEAAIERGLINPQRVQRIRDLTGAPGMYCDFCGARPDGLWLFPHEAFDVPGPRGTNLHCTKNEWGSCDDCARLFIRDDIQSLTEKALETAGKGMPGPALEAIYRALLGARAGAPVWITGPLDPRRRDA